MSEFTIQGLSVAFQKKDYAELFMFYSSAFDFTDRLESGLRRVGESFGEQEVARRFSISFYPVWNQPDSPYITAHMGCTYQQGKVSIDKLDLGYFNGAVNGELRSDSIMEPTLADIPDKTALKDRLALLANPVQATLNKTRRIKR